MSAEIVAVSLSARHTFSKTQQKRITLIAGRGVEGDAHAGATVKHRSRVAKDPTQPNLRQVHLLDEEVLAEIAADLGPLSPGEIGENILVRGAGLLGLSRDARLSFGGAVLRVTGLRNPCYQLDKHRDGLRRAFMPKSGAEEIRRAGVMAVVERGGEAAPGMAVDIAPPEGAHVPLEVV